MGLAAYQLILFVSNLIVPKAIIEQYGSEYNGMVASITQLLSLISILRIGVAGPTRVILYDSLANNNTYKTSAIMNATICFMRRIGVVLLIYIAALSFIYPILIKHPFNNIDVSLLVLAIGIGVCGEYFFGLPAITLLDADQRSYIYNACLSITLLLNTGLTIILIRSCQTIQVIKCVTSSLILIYYCVLLIITIRQYGIDIKIKECKEALRNRGDAFGHSFANIVHDNTDIFLLTFLCDIKTVSVYSIYSLIVGGITRVLNIFISGSEAVFGDMWAKGEKTSIKEWLSVFEFVIGFFIVVFFSTAMVMVIPFVKLYTRNVDDIEYTNTLYAAIAIVAQAFFCLRFPYVSLVQAAGKYRETKKAAYNEAALNIIISLVLVRGIGLYGVAIGTLLANIYRTVQYERYIRKSIVFASYKSFLKLITWIVLLSILLSFIGYRIVQMIEINTWVRWICTSSIVFGILTMCSLVMSLVFYNKELHSVYALINKMA